MLLVPSADLFGGGDPELDLRRRRMSLACRTSSSLNSLVCSGCGRLRTVEYARELVGEAHPGSPKFERAEPTRPTMALEGFTAPRARLCPGLRQPGQAMAARRYWRNNHAPAEHRRRDDKPAGTVPGACESLRSPAGGCARSGEWRRRPAGERRRRSPPARFISEARALLISDRGMLVDSLLYV